MFYPIWCAAQPKNIDWHTLFVIEAQNFILTPTRCFGTRAWFLFIHYRDEKVRGKKKKKLLSSSYEVIISAST